MLKVKIPAVELYDEEKNQFFWSHECDLQLEHSLVSLAKWESKWKKPFLSRRELTPEEAKDYIRCMTLTQNVDPAVYELMPASVVDQVKAYIDDPMTATVITRMQKRGGPRRVITAELLYCWMTMLNIPFECQKWHLNRLIMLIDVCNEEQKGPQKVGAKEQAAQRRALNAARRKQYNTRG